MKTGFLLAFALIIASASAWMDPAWQYRTPVSVSNGGNALADYPVSITLDTASLISAGKMRSDCGDIRFANSSDSPLPYWIESGCNTASTKVWVAIPYIPAGASSVYAYYRNFGATTLSNKSAAFVLFDNISDISGWTAAVSGNADVIYDAGRMRLRIYRCASAEAYKDLGAQYSGLTFDFDWWTAADNWMESDSWQVLVNGTSVYNEGFPVPRSSSTSGHKAQNVSAGGSTRVRFYQTPSGYCGNSDHGNTYLWVDNIQARKYAIPEPSPSLQQEESMAPIKLSISPAGVTTSPNMQESFTLYVYNNQSGQDNFTLSCTGICTYSENPVVATPYQNRSVGVTITSPGTDGTYNYAINATSQANPSNFVAVPVSVSVDVTRWRDSWHDAYGSEFKYRVPLTITNGGAALSDYAINFTANTASLISANKTRGDCGDLRFMNGTHEMPYWVESGCNTTSTKIWAKVPAIPAGSSAIYIYYGNPSATSLSNKSNAFVLFDPIDSISGWITSASGNADVIYDAGRMRLRVYRCASAEAYKDLGAHYSNVTFDFDWWTAADNWMESDLWQVLVNGTSVYNEGFPVPRSSSTSGHKTQSVSAGGTTRVRFYISPSGPCGNSDHGNTYLWVDNIQARKYAYPEPSIVLGAEQKKGYRILVRRCGLKQDGTNVTAYYPANATQAGSCITEPTGICTLDMNAGAYDVLLRFADNSTAWKNGTAFS